MRKPKKIIAAKTPARTKADLLKHIEAMKNELEAASRLIGNFQQEIRNLVTLNVSLTESVRNLSRKVD